MKIRQNREYTACRIADCDHIKCEDSSEDRKISYYVESITCIIGSKKRHACTWLLAVFENCNCFIHHSTWSWWPSDFKCRWLSRETIGREWNWAFLSSLVTHPLAHPFQFSSVQSDSSARRLCVIPVDNSNVSIGRSSVLSSAVKCVSLQVYRLNGKVIGASSVVNHTYCHQPSLILFTCTERYSAMFACSPEGYLSNVCMPCSCSSSYFLCNY